MDLLKTAPTRKTTSWFGYQFSLPSATIYKSLVFSIYGRSTTVPGIVIGAVDNRICPITSTSWDPGCVGSWTGVGFSTAWYSKSLSTTYNRSGLYVRAFAAANGAGGVAKARLRVAYGILR